MLMTFMMLALTLRDIAWLAGDWVLTRDDQCVEEHWTLPSDNSLIGMSRTVANNRTTEFEFVRIEARAGGVFYVAQPGGRPRFQAGVGVAGRAGVRQSGPCRSLETDRVPPRER